MKLLCIDFSNLVMRHAANPYGQTVDLDGNSVQGAFGSLRQVLRTIEQRKPTHLLIARDGKRSDSLRREYYESYKAHRPDSDPDMVRQFDLAYQGVELFGWPCLQVDRHEADDVIASAAIGFGGDVEIVTGDKDLLALCSEKITVILLRPGDELHMDSAGCHNLVGVYPHQLTDFKALVGDASDGIPGVQGVGAKTACILLSQYQTLDAVLARLDAGEPLEGIRPHIAAKIDAGREQALMSRRLAALVCDLDIDIGLLTCPDRPDDAKIGEQLRQLGLGDLRYELRGERKPVPGKANGPFSIEDAFRAATGG